MNSGIECQYRHKTDADGIISVNGKLGFNPGFVVNNVAGRSEAYPCLHQLGGVTRWL